MRWSSLLVISLIAAGCATDPTDLCRDAADHVATCIGEEPATSSETCDEARAEALLAMDCGDLAAAAAAGKSDGSWPELMCSLGYTSYCSQPSGPNGPSTTLRTLTGNVQKLGSTDPAIGVSVRLIREGMETEVHQARTFAGGLFSIQGLARAPYRLEVALAPTSAALVKKRIDLATQTYILIHAPVP
jgi:hypothetical protein